MTIQEMLVKLNELPVSETTDIWINAGGYIYPVAEIIVVRDAGNTEQAMINVIKEGRTEKCQ